MIARVAAALDGIAARLLACVYILVLRDRATAGVMALHATWPDGGDLLSQAMVEETARVVRENQEMRREMLADRRRLGDE